MFCLVHKCTESVVAVALAVGKPIAALTPCQRCHESGIVERGQELLQSATPKTCFGVHTQTKPITSLQKVRHMCHACRSSACVINFDCSLDKSSSYSLSLFSLSLWLVLYVTPVLLCAGMGQGPWLWS